MDVAAPAGGDGERLEIDRHAIGRIVGGASFTLSLSLMGRALRTSDTARDTEPD